jgi:hypothetical protein
MTPKEKAKKLFDKYYIVCQEYTEEIQCSIQAKECALIAVDEVINSNPCCEDSDRGGNFQWASNEYYWQEVKQEIEKL